MTTVSQETAGQKEHELTYYVDAEPQETKERVLTPTQILERAGIDPATHYLVELEGQHQKSFQNAPDEEIHLHEQERFISVRTGPTPVS